jgi:gamma-glutamylcyclotransferase (GGCT)/AIG2-like uncharacterized protein YtfP
MKLFTYGTLKRGHDAHDLLVEFGEGSFVKEAVTTPEYHLYDHGGMPGMVVDPALADGGVHGEVYEVDDECLRHLDYYECVERGLFRREFVTLTDGTKAQAYLYNEPIRERAMKIHGGIWDESL